MLILGSIQLYLFILLATYYGWATYDLGILQKLFLASAELPIIIGTTKLYFYLSFPTLFRYIDRDFDENNQWNALTETEKVKEGLRLYSFYFLSFVVLVAMQ